MLDEKAAQVPLNLERKKEPGFFNSPGMGSKKQKGPGFRERLSNPSSKLGSAVIGGGFPAGAVVGRAEIMDVMNPETAKLRYPLSGTFSANPMTMTAGLVAMQHFDRAAVARLNALAARAIHGIGEAIARTGARACVTGSGSMFRVHMKERVPANYREAYTTPEESKRLKMLLDHLFDEGFMMINTCSATLSTPMGEAEIDALVAAMESGFRRMVAAG